MPSTSRGYPYPAGGDPANGPASLQSLAAAVDSDVAGSVSNMAVTSLGDVGTFVSGAYDDNPVPVANDAIVAVFRPTATITPTKFAWWCVVSSGNYDVGIINATTRARLWSLGSTAGPGAGAIVNTIVAGPTLTAGVRYAMVFAANNTTLTFRSLPNILGQSILYDGTIAFGRCAASFPIPATLPVWAETTVGFGAALRA